MRCESLLVRCPGMICKPEDFYLPANCAIMCGHNPARVVFTLDKETFVLNRM